MSRYSILSNDMDKVYSASGNSLWLGSLKAAKNISLLRENNIKTVITVANNINPELKGFKHYVFNIEDNISFCIIEYFTQINEIIEDGLKYGSVLVHCVAGVSRSSACIIAYLMFSQKWSYEQTYYYLKEKRLTINPNQGFKKQLTQYYNQLNRFQKTQSQSDLVKQSKLQLSPRFINKSSEDLMIQLIQNNIKSPSRKIEQLNQQSTIEGREIYRFQLAQKLFQKSLKNINQNNLSKIYDQVNYDQHTVKSSMYYKTDYYAQTDRAF